MMYDGVTVWRYDGVLPFHSSQYLLMSHILLRRDCYDLLNIHVKNIFVFWYVTSCTLVASYLPLFSIEDSKLTIETVSTSETSATSYQTTSVTSWICTVKMQQIWSVTFISRKSTFQKYVCVCVCVRLTDWLIDWLTDWLWCYM
jgi:hypothetical protein